jgi:uncharacterized protein (TIGR03792 family)
MSSFRGLVMLCMLVLLVGVGGQVLEFLECSVWCSDTQAFLAADNKTWNQFLKAQPGFIRKELLARPTVGSPSNCTFTASILWESREIWKSIDPQKLAAVDAAFVLEFGYEPLYTPRPTSEGYDVIATL